MEILCDKRCAFALGKTESVLIILTLNGTLLELLVSKNRAGCRACGLRDFRGAARALRRSAAAPVTPA